jgi:amino acid permease
MTITSKKHFFKFYLAATGGVVFCVVMAIMVFSLRKQATSGFGEAAMWLMIIALLCGAFYTVIRYYKNAPLIQLDNESITFNHAETYFWKDLEKIELTGKKPFKFIDGNDMEATTLYFKGGGERYFFDDMYANSAMMKSFIDQVIVNKKPGQTVSISKIDPRELAEQRFQYFNG